MKILTIEQARALGYILVPGFLRSVTGRRLPRLFWKHTHSTCIICRGKGFCSELSALRFLTKEERSRA